MSASPNRFVLSALVLACAFFSFQHERFLTLQNFSLILQQVMVVGVLAIGQTLIILTAGIDLSCGMLMALSSIVMTKFAVDFGLAPAVSIGAGLLTAMLLGWIAGEMAITDPAVKDWVDANAHWLHEFYVPAIVGAIAVLLIDVFVTSSLCIALAQAGDAAAAQGDE